MPRNAAAPACGKQLGPDLPPWPQIPERLRTHPAPHRTGFLHPAEWFRPAVGMAGCPATASRPPRRFRLPRRHPPHRRPLHHPLLHRVSLRCHPRTRRQHRDRMVRPGTRVRFRCRLPLPRHLPRPPRRNSAGTNWNRLCWTMWSNRPVIRRNWWNWMPIWKRTWVSTAFARRSFWGKSQKHLKSIRPRSTSMTCLWMTFRISIRSSTFS